MIAQHKPKKRMRVYREAHSQEVHDDGHSWAVSYADFLMVLLSFFIIFFSVDKNERKELIEQIASTTGGPNSAGAQQAPAKKGSQGGPAEEPGTSKASNQRRLPSGISEVAKGLDGFFVEHEDKSQKLYIYFDDNMFRPGEIEMPRDQIHKLNQILTRVEPYMKDVNITFIGHTDSSVVSRGKNRYVSNNFDLSSLRATKALQEAVKLGFNPTKMFAKGVAEHSKGTRTISLVITPGEDER
jgi:flagellar motor protein MotB